MSEGFDFSAFQAEITRTSEQLLSADPSATGQVKAALATQNLSEKVLLQHQKNTEHIACRAGCGHCCQVNVAVLPAEAEAIIDRLHQTLAPAEISILQQKVRHLYRQVGGLSDEERLLARASCLFLDPWGQCNIYPVRPLLCRSLTSTDPEACRDAIALAALDEAPQITSHLFQQNLYYQAFCGLAAALAATGLEDRSQQLTEAIWARLPQA